jgi:integrase
MASIDTVRDGNGRAIRYRVRFRTPTGEQRSKTFTRKIDAQAFIDGTGVALSTGAFVDPVRGRTTFEAWWERWWPTQLGLRASTRARDEGYARVHIHDRFDGVQLASIDRVLVETWIAELIAKGLAPATIHKCVQILAKALRGAVESGMIATNPCARVSLPKIERDEMRFLDPTQVAELTEAIDARYRAMVLLGAYGGLRLGEMLALDASRVDLLRRRVDVAVTLYEVRGQMTTNPPKTRAGRRSVPIPKVVADALGEHLGGRAEGPVFTAPEGGPVRASLWRRRFWAPATTAAGLAPLRPHDLRHTAVAMWIAAGASPKEIAVRAGHSSVVTVLDRYGHLLPGTEDRVTDALDRMASAAPSATASVTQITTARSAG